jgi:tripartite-type tricarboxylate transporter receptor subunit TctC
MKRRIFLAGLGSVLAATSSAQAASGWPTKTVRIIVPYPPGGSSDIIARVISEPLSEALKQKVVVENKAGANGNLGAELVAKSDPDGHSLLLCDVGALAISPSVYTKLTFNPSRDLRGVTMLAYSPHLLVVHPSVSASNLSELVELSKKTPMNLAISGIGGAPHLAAVAIAQATGAKWQYVPYKGGSQAVSDTVAGQTQILMNGALATLSFVQSGKLKPIGVSKRTRMPLIGQMPTLAEQGVSNFESGSWQGVLASANLPAAALERLNNELIRIIRLPEVREKLSGQGAEIVTQSPAEFSKFFEAERKRWAQVVAKTDVKLD